MGRFKLRKLSDKLVHKYLNGGSALVFFGALTAVLLILLLSMISIYFWRTKRLINEQCYTELTASTKEACNDLEDRFRLDRINLRMIAKVLAEEKFTSEKAGSYLEMYDVNSAISSVGILTQKNTVVLKNGESIDVSDKLKYKDEIIYGDHISALQPAILSTGSEKVIRSFVPIRRKGKSVGLLFAEMNPANIAKAWNPQIYDGACTFCIIDRFTGNIVVTNSTTSKSLAELGDKDLSNLILGGGTGFRSVDVPTDDGKVKTYFASFKPMELEKWEMLLMVSEDEVFESTQSLSSSLYLLLAFMGSLFVLYLVMLVFAYRRSIERAEVRANIDVLTGLRNRNLYEQFCSGYDSTGGLYCIYIDANGLHELNNTRGHLAGDQMLRFVADALKVEFGEETVFRIGGDEFIVFCKGRSDKVLRANLTSVYNEIERNNYHISAGVGVGAVGINIKALIKVAEEEMYEEKKRYYERIGAEMRNKKEEPENEE